MTIALDLIKGALRKIGMYASGESVDAVDAQDALDQLNGMLDIWSNQQLAIYNNVENIFTWVPGKTSYTVGPGGDIPITRPLRLNDSYTRLTTTGSTVDFPCKAVEFSQYARIGLKAQPGPWPKILYYNTGFPLATLTPWPVPSQGGECHLWADMLFGSFSTTADAVSLPPGYVLGVETNLACLLAPEYGVEPSAELKEQARTFLRVLKDTNQTPQAISTYEGGLSGRPAADAGWILSGGFGYN